jgi:hypothetical protein
MPKKFKPSADVRIETNSTADGREILDITIGAAAMQRLAKSAGVSGREIAWLHIPLKLVLYQLLVEADQKKRPAASGLDHLQTLRVAARRLLNLLDAWTTIEMLGFEDRELRQRWFGTKAFPDLRSRPEARPYMAASEKIGTDLRQEKQAIERLFARSSAMVDERKSLQERGLLRPAEPSALDPTKRHIADCALQWWTHLGHDTRASKRFVAFTDELYRLAGIRLKPDAIRAQLAAARERRDARSHGG